MEEGDVLGRKTMKRVRNFEGEQGGIGCRVIREEAVTGRVDSCLFASAR
jgi:hypothetical protein